MHRRPSLAIVLICLPLIALAGKPPQSGSTPKQYSIEQLLKNVRVGGPHFSGDESKVLYSSNVTGVFNAWTVPSRGGAPQPITHSTTESIFAGARKNGVAVEYVLFPDERHGFRKI